MSETTFDFMKLWTQSDEESEFKMKTVLLDGLDSVTHSRCDVLSKIKVAKPVSGPVASWMEESGYPSTISARLTGTTMVFTGALFGQPINSDSIKKVIREGTVLERQSDGGQVKVASVQALSAVVHGYGASVLTDDPDSSAWDIISEVWSDYRDASGPRSLDRKFREVGTQIFAETFEIPKTRKNTRYEIVKCEAEHQILALLEKLRRQLAYAVLRSRPCHDGSQFVWGNKTDEPTMCGLCAWPIITQSELPNSRVCVDKVGEALTKFDLDNLVRSLWLDEHADYNKGDWRLVCHPTTHQFIHDFDISYRRTQRRDRDVGSTWTSSIQKSAKPFPYSPSLS